MFCLRVPRTVVEEPFCVSIKSGSEIFFMQRRGGRHGIVEKRLVSEGLVSVRIFSWIRRGYHDFLSEIFRLTVPKKTVGETFNVSENLGYRRFFCIRKGISQFSVETNLPHKNEKLRKWSLLFFRKFLIRKKLCIRDNGRGGRLSQFCVEKRLSQGAMKLRGELFIVSKSWGCRKVLSISRGYNCSSFKRLFLTVLRVFVQEPSCVSNKNPVSNNFLQMRGWGPSRYCRKKFSFRGLKQKTL